ncbi:ATP-dependent DNA ligase [Frigoriglobus tundricola]|uniref:DNA ligase (ATP) n=1 Tax=Frigoriglobus tundricola TaxID=2774151 RepID=A0A6M5YYQ5_9BACT|nr:ATP-dependent DNA ligase [Frigoriglobus tundricola]QJW98381.1 ATP-dependent DNA ligase LigC [Frigoriglobus tundricola]
MKAFAELYAALDATTKTTGKVEALARYFAGATPEDAAWAVYFLSGRKPRQAVPSKRLRLWARELAGVPEWLFDEAYHHVGDVAETVALLLPSADRASDAALSEWVGRRLLPLRDLEEEAQKAAVLRAWAELDAGQRFVWNKLITGEFRVGVSQLLVVRALAQVSKLPADVISHRLMGTWEPTPAFYTGLVAADSGDAERSRPYPFFLAHPLEGDPAALGSVADWQAEWKWDGIRAQVVRRGGQAFVWSRGEELVTDRYPELAAMAAALPDGTVLDGELLPWRRREGAVGEPAGDSPFLNGQVQPFADLQKRIGRKTVSKKLLDEIPVVLVAYDLIEAGGADLRERPLAERRDRLEELVGAVKHPALILSPRLALDSWDALARERTASRERRVEGMMLKRRGSPYRVGRVRGDWWKWKVEPFTVDAVLINAQGGHGKRSGLYTDYTFAVWDGGTLVPIAKAYSGLTDAEIKKVDAFVRANTLEKFGPVRAVRPELVFELGFEGIQLSTRHKSGIAVRFPRMLRWRTDKKPEEADTLGRVKALLNVSAEGWA